MDTPKGKSRRGLKICCGVTLAITVIFIVVAISLIFTVFKPKDPQIIAHPTNLENVQFQLVPNVSLNATLVLNLTIDNRNYGGFEFKESVAYVYYRGILIGQVPVEHSKVQARSSLIITAYANITGGQMVMDPNFYNDIGSGQLNFTSTAMMHGRVNVLKIIKARAKVNTLCDITVNISTLAVDPKCHSKVKF